MPLSRATRAMTGAAPVPVPPPMPAVMNTMFEPCIASRMSSIASSAAARPTSGREPAPSPRVTPMPSWILRGAFDNCSACASVLQAMNSQPTRFERIMLLTALPPAPPTPTTVMRGFSSCSSFGTLRLIMISLPHRSDRRGAACPYYRTRPARGTRCSQILAQPVTDAPEAAEHAADRAALRPRRLGALAEREMQQPRRGRKGRAVRRFGEAREAQRAADADILVEDQRGQLAHPMKLAGAAGEDDAAAGDLVEAADLEAMAHQLEGLFQARRDDADEQRFRHVVDVAVLLFADLRHRDGFALVERRRDGAAPQRLHPLGMGERGGQAAGDVVGDVAAAHRHAVGEDHVAVEEHADRRRAAAHVDDGDAELHLVLDEAGEAGGIGADHQRVDVEMGAADDGAVVAHRRGGGGDQVHVDAEPLADHAARVADAAALVDRKADRDRVDHLAVVAVAHL